MPTVLLVEDESRLASAMIRTLRESGYDVAWASSLESARKQFNDSISVLVLDLMLPDGNGLAWLSELRRTQCKVPIIILTARDSVQDRVTGLDAGADDYLVKPFSLEELLARIRARLRSGPVGSANILTVGPLSADLLNRTATRDGRRLELQNRQFEFLVFLMRHANQIVDRKTIAKEVWKESTATWTNVIDVHVNQLRKQLESLGQSRMLHTVRGQGYVLGDPP